jgi:hypothetical protein
MPNQLYFMGVLLWLLITDRRVFTNPLGYNFLEYARSDQYEKAEELLKSGQPDANSCVSAYKVDSTIAITKLPLLITIINCISDTQIMTKYVKLLLASGANPNSRLLSYGGEYQNLSTPLHIVAKHLNILETSLAYSRECILAKQQDLLRTAQLLVTWGANPKLTNFRGETPLELLKRKVPELAQQWDSMLHDAACFRQASILIAEIGSCSAQADEKSTSPSTQSNNLPTSFFKKCPDKTPEDILNIWKKVLKILSTVKEKDNECQSLIDNAVNKLCGEEYMSLSYGRGHQVTSENVESVIVSCEEIRAHNVKVGLVDTKSPKAINLIQELEKLTEDGILQDDETDEAEDANSLSASLQP